MQTSDPAIYAVGDVVTVSLIEVDEDRRRIDFRISRARH